MKLHSLHIHRSMPQPHDLVLRGPGTDLEAIGKRLALDEQGVIPRSLERRRQPLEDAASVMQYRRGLAVHEPSGANHPAAECLADCLVS
jgi:hypothetical protein